MIPQPRAPATLPSLTIQMLTVAVLTLERQLKHIQFSPHQPFANEYDFVVVGAGGAGAIVAARLSENSTVSVLLLEAGGTESVATDIPALYHHWVTDSANWNYPMVPQPLLGQAFQMPAQIVVGRIMGGSTTISGMVYNRGNKRHFDQWDYEYGCRGWNYATVLPYFLRSENQTFRKYLADTIHHNVSGPINVVADYDQASEIPVFLDYLETARQAGFPTIDFNGPSQLGATLFEHTIRNGVKVTSSEAYLTPNRNRSNLRIITGAVVNRVLFDGNVATGVTFTRNGNHSTVMARREVILSAGTIASAQLLLLSGVGPRQHLTEVGIDVIADLPVGENLHDHTNTILYFDVPDQRQSYSAVQLTVADLYNYYVNGRGPLTMFPNSATYIVTDQNDDDRNWPDVMTEMVRSNDNWTTVDIIASQYQDRSAWSDYWRPYAGRRLLAFDVQMVRPRARGRMRLNVTDPEGLPVVDPNYFGNVRDVNAMVYGVRKVLTQITTVGPFSRTARYIDTPVPGCERLCPAGERFCDRYIRCLILQTSVPVYRHVGTCRCGQPTDRNAVVDARLRVISVQRLRVIDGSIMPQVINANSWAATAMIAEYGSQMIRDDHGI